MVERRTAQQKPGAGSRQVQLTQLEKRYSASFKKISDTVDGTTVRLAMKPTDPDFPFDLESLQLQVLVPANYPTQSPSITVMNSDIPKGFAINLERGYEAYATSSNTTLVRQLSWLDRNMEQLLQQQASETIRFISYPKRDRNTVAPALPDHIIQAAAATRPSYSTMKTTTISSTSTSAAVSSSSSSSSSSAPTPKPRENATTPTFATAYSDSELAAAFGQRSRQINQLKTRLGNSFKASKSDRTVLFISFALTDPDFTHGSLFDDGTARIRYHVPLQYPLIPCHIDIDNKTIGKPASSMIVQSFDYHAKVNTDYTLFEHLNWLNRHLESILNSPPAPEEVNIITPFLRPIRPPTLPPTTTRPATTTGSSTSTNKKSIFMDDQTKNKVIMVSDPSLVKPPGVTSDGQQHMDISSDEDGHVSDASITTSDQEQAPSSSSAANLEVSQQQSVRRGTEIRLMDPQLENVSLFRCVSLHVLVKCSRCKNTVDMENVVPEPPTESGTGEGKNNNNGKTAMNKKERWTDCPTCHSIIGVKFFSELIHENASSLGLLQLAGCTAFDLLGSSFMGTCGSCMDDMKSSIRLAPHDRPTTHACFGCHTKWTVALNDYRFVSIGQGGERLVADEEQVMKLKNKRKLTKEAALLGGQPLPNEGTCSHYQKSKRWFRFNCCGKLYACDVCHDKKEDHIYEMATRHVCGLCSKEQSAVGNKPCVSCGHEFDKTIGKGAFWEGGHGVRNRTLMNRNDSHKHKGQSKTGSKKQDRVGLAAKQKREKEHRQNDD